MLGCEQRIPEGALVLGREPGVGDRGGSASGTQGEQAGLGSERGVQPRPGRPVHRAGCTGADEVAPPGDHVVGQASLGGVEGRGDGDAVVEARPHVGELGGVARTPHIPGDRRQPRTGAMVELVGEGGDVAGEGVGQEAAAAATDPGDEAAVGEDGSFQVGAGPLVGGGGPGVLCTSSGPDQLLAASSSAWTDTRRRQAIAAGSAVAGQPTWEVTWSADESASAWGQLMQLPLSITARANSPREPGAAKCPHADQPPADSPPMVTRRGSPPMARSRARPGGSSG
jgi:hypothetical protein